MKKLGLAIFAFVLLFVSFGTNLAAEGIDFYDSDYSYFDTVYIVDTPCYVVYEALDGTIVAYDSAFFLPVGVYDGYKATLGVLADVCKTRKGLPEDALDGIYDILYDIYANYDYGSACLNDAAARRVEILWERAEYYWDEEDEDKLKVIRECLPEWAYQICEAVWQITYFLGDVYDFANGNSYWDDYDELIDYYKNDADLVAALDFIYAYYPDIDFDIF